MILFLNEGRASRGVVEALGNCARSSSTSGASVVLLAAMIDISEKPGRCSHSDHGEGREGVFML